jgi:dihydrofolate reductase
MTMKQKNIVFIAKSLDGYIAGKNGELDWLQAIPNPDGNDMGYSDLMAEIDAVVMGRTTYETVLGFGGEWPYSKPVFVLSHALKEVPAAINDKVTLLYGAENEILKKIHKLGYNNLYIDGGRVVQGFLKANLIDELRITSMPILLGGGFPLFTELPNVLNFKHLKTVVFLDQVVQSHYERLK